MRVWAPCYEDLTRGSKADIARASRFVFLELCLAVVRAGTRGVLQLRAKASEASAILDVVGGSSLEVSRALKELTLHGMIEISIDAGAVPRRFLRIVGWDDWAMVQAPRPEPETCPPDASPATVAAAVVEAAKSAGAIRAARYRERLAKSRIETVTSVTERDGERDGRDEKRDASRDKKRNREEQHSKKRDASRVTSRDGSDEKRDASRDAERDSSAVRSESFAEVPKELDSWPPVEPSFSAFAGGVTLPSTPEDPSTRPERVTLAVTQLPPRGVTLLAGLETTSHLWKGVSREELAAVASRCLALVGSREVSSMMRPLSDADIGAIVSASAAHVASMDGSPAANSPTKRLGRFESKFGWVLKDWAAGQIQDARRLAALPSVHGTRYDPSADMARIASTPAVPAPQRGTVPVTVPSPSWSRAAKANK